MRFLTYDELTPSMEVDRTLIHLASFGGAFPRRAIDVWRRRTKAFAEYVGVFAVERGTLLGQTFVLRIPYTFVDGPEFVTGIAAVGTRPDRGRAGVARAILTEIHRREKEAGTRFSTLWTNRSWGAHHLYEKLGYRDVYSAPWVVHPAAPTHGPRPGGVRPARSSDLVEIERFHARQSRGRLGFLRDMPGYLRAAVAAGELDPAKELLVAVAGGQLVGYAHVDSNPYRTVCGELEGSSRSVRRALIAEVGRRAKQRPFAFQHTPVTDDPDLFQGASWSRAGTGWYVFMASSLGHRWTSRSAGAQFTTADPRFLCMSGDRF